MIRRLKKGEADLYKMIRLAALKDAPEAFSSTYESALLRSKESWIEQADGSAEGTDRATFLTFDRDNPIAMAALYKDKTNSPSGELLQMWVSPDHRGGKVAIDLVDNVFRWASRNGFTEVRAEVIRTNGRAIRFYQKCGFRSEDILPDGGTVILVKNVEQLNTTKTT